MLIQRRNAYLLIVVLTALMAAYASVATLSASTGKGAFAPVRGELKRVSPHLYHLTIQARRASLVFLKMPREAFHRTVFTTVINDRRRDVPLVRMPEFSLSTEMSEGLVKTGMTRLRGRPTSELAHVFSAQRQA